MIKEILLVRFFLTSSFASSKTKVDEEDVLDYILHLDDMEYLKLIAKTSNRVVEEKMV